MARQNAGGMPAIGACARRFFGAACFEQHSFRLGHETRVLDSSVLHSPRQASDQARARNDPKETVKSGGEGGIKPLQRVFDAVVLGQHFLRGIFGAFAVAADLRQRARGRCQCF